MLAVVGLLLAGQRGNLPAVTEDAERLPDMVEAADAVQYHRAATARADLGEDLRALALISLGSTEYWTARFEDAAHDLERGVALARQIGRPYLEFTGLAYQAAAELYHSFTRAADHSRQAVELAQRHGWTSDPAFGVACMVLGTVLTRRRQLDEAELWVQRAERTLTAEAAQPAMSAGIRYVRGMLDQAENRDAEALAAFQAAEPLARRLAAPHYLIPRIRATLLQALVRLGQTERAGQFLAALGKQDREHGEIRIAAAALQLAQNDPLAATAEIAPVLDGSAPVVWRTGLWLAQAYLLEALAQDALGDQAAAGTALERALDLAEPNGDLTPFLLYPAPDLLERHAGHRTAHASLLAEIHGLLTGARPAPPPAGPQPAGLPPAGPAPQLEPLRDSEIRVLRYLPTNLTAPEIARELSVSLNTIKTHMRNLYVKLGTHHRGEAVERARALGLLAPSSVGRTRAAG
jgi:LuxR family transcriptional regulator, maltose regulon positive regulatory protein